MIVAMRPPERTRTAPSVTGGTAGRRSFSVSPLGAAAALLRLRPLRRGPVGISGRATIVALLGIAAPLVAAYPAQAALPDGRVYEMVTPAENQNAEVYAPDVPSASGPADGSPVLTDFPMQAAANGDRVAYLGAPQPVGGTESIGTSGGNEYLGVRAAAGGWDQVQIQPVGVNHPIFQGFSPELTFGFLDSPDPLSSQAPPEGFDDIYVTSLPNGGSYTPALTAAPPYRSQATLGAPGIDTNTHLRTNGNALAYAGSSADSRHILFMANDALTSAEEGRPAAEGGTASNYARENNLYEAFEGRLRLVNVLPNGTTKANASFGTPDSNSSNGNLEPSDFRNVISTDGSRVFWTDLTTGHLYVRENGATTTEISSAGEYLDATPDGSKVLYIDQEVEGGKPKDELYEYEVEGAHNTDLTPGVKVLGLAGMSEDGRYVYYVTDAFGLEVWHDGVSVKIATLDETDDQVGPYGSLCCAGIEGGDWQVNPGALTAEVTPDGHSVAFESRAQLTTYNNGGREEVYDYNVDSGRLSCASCNPSGPPTTSYLAGFVPISYSNNYQTRFISADGSHVFFYSQEALVPEDTNGVLDVYEWDREGTASCPEQTPARLNNGCLFLLSGGTGNSDSFLLDASANGSDVFIVSRAELAPQDEGELYALFDARVNGYVPTVAPLCSGTGCQGVPGTPPIFATPASATFIGVGNFTPEPQVTTTSKTKKKHGPRKHRQDKHKKRHKKGKMGRSRSQSLRANGKAAR